MSSPSQWIRPLQVLLITSMALSSCADVGEPWGTAYGRINFYDYSIGQVSRYVHFVGYPGLSNPDYTVYYQPDTLILEIVQRNSDGFVVMEYMSANSRLRTDPTTMVAASQIRHFNVALSRDTVWLSGNSWMLDNFMTNHISLLCPLPVRPIPGPELPVEGWSVWYLGDSEFHQGYVKDYVQCGHLYDRLNIVNDGRMTPADGAARVAFFSRLHGFVRVFSAGTRVDGWDLL